jgi:hypothetical protein
VDGFLTMGFSKGRLPIFSMNFLSTVKTHHNKHRKKKKNMINDMTGQIAMLSIL